MARITLIEKYALHWLRESPQIKMAVKRVYLHFFWCLQLGSWGAVPRHNATALTNISGHNFFGYFDTCPENDAGLILMHHLPDGFEGETPIEILVLSRKTDEIVASTSSLAYNWQQGARAQWLDESRFIYNDFCPNKKCYIAKIHNVEMDKTESELPLGVQSSYKDKYMLSLNIERISAYSSDYGYRNIVPDIGNTLLDLQQDGIWHCDLTTRKYQLVLTFERILAEAELQYDERVEYSLNHIAPSTSGDIFVFVLRYYVRGQRTDKLLVYSIVTGELKVVNHGPVVSHFVWKNEEELILYATDNDGTNRYHSVNVWDNSRVDFHNGILDDLGDGHPTIMGDKLVVDTYPNRFGIQSLVCFDLKTQKLELLGRFAHSPFFFGATRCDLHPRFSKNGQSIFIDSVASGKRNFYSLDLIS